ncbi:MULTISPECIES: Uma2 family endonuclease [Streptomyces]|uniref:Uma2 family endonuclease n=1 Tax=Streptomyces TaxID=1883 RepID=UPI002257CE76|nr:MULTISPECIES: Uma2 family endonuclease [Streptomyces]MCX4436130.1 Uma2 family endonuclease [Streptomyces mirabilis]
MSPGSKLRYKKAMKSLRRQLEPHAPKGHDVDVAPFLFVFPGAERGFGPDLHVADEAAFDAEGRHADGEALSLVAELTSTSTKDVDWLDKLDAYGRVVPVHLVLDMQAFEQAANTPDPAGPPLSPRHTAPRGDGPKKNVRYDLRRREPRPRH